MATFSQLDQLVTSRGHSTSEVLGWIEDALYREAPATEHPEHDWTDAEAAVLEHEGIDVSPLRAEETDVLDATQRGYIDLLGSGWTVNDTAHHLSVSPSRIRQMLSQRKLYGIRPRGRAWVLPEWQFSGSGLIPGIEAVNQAFDPALHPLTVSGFLHHPKPELDLGFPQTTTRAASLYAASMTVPSPQPAAGPEDESSRLSPLQWLASGGDPNPVVALAKEL
ncbi:MAG: hypothetical protein ACYDGY_11130 [Acidimicrobiales bacterium]